MNDGAELDCDLLVVGGGLAGSALALVMARAGASVVVVERERAFRDRIRGEVLHPWGVAEAHALDLVEPLLRDCAREMPMLTGHVGGAAGPTRDTRVIEPHRLASLTFAHPAMQETLLAEAGRVATVLRGSTVTSLKPGPTPCATVSANGASRLVRARLVVGADGRDSIIAGMLDLPREGDSEELITSGMLVECDGLPPDSVHVHRDPHGGRMAILLSPAPGLQRVYLIYRHDALPRRLSGARDLPEALRHLHEIGVPDAHMADARLRGPYASFDGAHRWITTPYRDGVALIGDAAGVSDPAWGCGLSRTLRDVRLLRDALLADDQWTTAAPAYALQHDDAFQRLRKLERLYAELFMASGEEADELRGRLGPVLAEHPHSTIALCGPEMEHEHLERLLGELARARLSGYESSVYLGHREHGSP